jgi:hypothetical protein
MYFFTSTDRQFGVMECPSFEALLFYFDAETCPFFSADARSLLTPCEFVVDFPIMVFDILAVRAEASSGCIA